MEVVSSQTLMRPPDVSALSKIEDDAVLRGSRGERCDACNGRRRCWPTKTQCSYFTKRRYTLRSQGCGPFGRLLTARPAVRGMHLRLWR